MLQRVWMPEPIDIILLAYNRMDYLRRMVDALEANTVWPYRLTIVDNVSGPETRQWLRDNEARFHQIVWNRRNEHLAGHQRGIEATESELFVVSDADLLPHPPTADGCWLTRLVGLADRYRDFGLIASRIDSDSIRTSPFEGKLRVDGEIIETETGVWLNLMRRGALRVPYMSDGITCYALKRAGYRVGVAQDVFCTHLGDEDVGRHPDYLARKQAATALGVVYPDYPEVQDIPRPPSLDELASPCPCSTRSRHTASRRLTQSSSAIARGRRPPRLSRRCRARRPSAARRRPRGATRARRRWPPAGRGQSSSRWPTTTSGCSRRPRRGRRVGGRAHARAGSEARRGLAGGRRASGRAPGAAAAGAHRRAATLAARAGLLDVPARRAVARGHARRLRSARTRCASTSCAASRATGGGALARRQAGRSRGEPPPWNPLLQRSNRTAALATKALRLARAEWHLRRP